LPLPGAPTRVPARPRRTQTRMDIAVDTK
jgi:hypothetical protein